jgi:hypothetical protein
VNYDGQRLVEAPPFSDRRIIQSAEELTKKYVQATSPDPMLLTINFDHVYENYIYPEYGIALEEDCNLGHDEQGKKILGRFDIETNTAFIDASLGPGSRDPRRAFTCWHEVGGHGVLQGEWLRRELGRFHRFIMTTEEIFDGKTHNELERQANLFAARSAAPTWFLQHVIHEVYAPTHPIRYTGPGRYCLSINGATRYHDVEDFNFLCRIVAYYINSRFGGLSSEALGYRIAQLGFVTDATRSGIHLNRVAKPSVCFPGSFGKLAAAVCRS